MFNFSCKYFNIKASELPYVNTFLEESKKAGKFLTEYLLFNNEEQTARNEAFYNSILNNMLDLLEKMDENNYDYKELDFKEIYERQEEAKNKFFELFSKYFYALWD